MHDYLVSYITTAVDGKGNSATQNSQRIMSSDFPITIDDMPKFMEELERQHVVSGYTRTQSIVIISMFLLAPRRQNV